MASNVIISIAAQNAAAAAIAALTDAGSGPGTITIYDGAKPATPATAITSQTALVILTFPDPAYGTPVNGQASVTSASITDMPALASGVPSWARERDSNGSTIKDWTAGVDGSGAGIIVKVSPFVSGIDVGISSMSFTMPSGA